MAYPTPSIYTYRVRQVQPIYTDPISQGYFEAQYSTNSGTTWLPIFTNTFESLIEAFQAIGILVQDESAFQKSLATNIKFGVNRVAPTVSHYSYPPS